MCVDRRGFMQVAAGAAGASLLVSRRASSEEAPLPKSLESLSSMVTDIEPITDEERKGRIANAQRLMKENGLGAVSTLCRAMQRLARRLVVYADETGWKQGGRRVWLWVFSPGQRFSITPACAGARASACSPW